MPDGQSSHRNRRMASWEHRFSSHVWTQWTVCLWTTCTVCVLEGVTKWLLNMWMSSKNHGKPFYLGASLKTIDALLVKQCPPHEFSRPTRTIIKDVRYWKASEYRTWLLYYALPLLSDFLPPLFLHHISLLVTAIHLLLKVDITDTNIVCFVPNYHLLWLTPWTLQTGELHCKRTLPHTSAEVCQIVGTAVNSLSFWVREYERPSAKQHPLSNPGPPAAGLLSLSEPGPTAFRRTLGWEWGGKYTQVFVFLSPYTTTQNHV